MRLDRLADLDELVHQGGVDVQAAGGVDDQDVLAVLLARSSAHRAISTGSRVGALLVDVGADLRAELHELVDGGRAVDVACGERDRRAVLRRAGSARASRAAVVLPEPCRPAMRITVGGRGENVMPAEAPPISAASSSWTIFTTCWPGLSCADDLGAEAALLDGRRELLDDLEVDVGLEQRETDLAHRLVDVVLGQRAVGADVGERLLELLGKGVEHGPPVYGAAACADAGIGRCARVTPM